jgi:hypothetical protein
MNRRRDESADRLGRTPLKPLALAIGDSLSQSPSGLLHGLRIHLIGFGSDLLRSGQLRAVPASAQGLDERHR